MLPAALAVLLAAAGAPADDAACLSGNRDACVRAAKTAETEKRWADWKDLLARACNLRHGASCHQRAELADDMTTAAAYREKGCKAGDMLSCELYGKQLQQGYGVPKNEKAGTALLEKACKGAGGACRSLAFSNPNGARYVVLLEQACAGGDTAVSCLIAGDLFAEGKRVKADPLKAKLYWTKACSPLQPAACTKAGIPVPRP